MQLEYSQPCIQSTHNHIFGSEHMHEHHHHARTSATKVAIGVDNRNSSPKSRRLKLAEICDAMVFRRQSVMDERE